MLNGEGNENSEKATLHVQQTFFVHFFAVVLHDVKLLETSWLHVLWRKCGTCTWTPFFLPPLFFLVAASTSHFVTAATKFSCCSSNEKCLLCFSFLALALCLPFSRWALLACRLLSLFLRLSLYSRFLDMTINLRQHGNRKKISSLLTRFSCLCFNQSINQSINFI